MLFWKNVGNTLNFFGFGKSAPTFRLGIFLWYLVDLLCVLFLALIRLGLLQGDLLMIVFFLASAFLYDFFSLLIVLTELFIKLTL